MRRNTLGELEQIVMATAMRLGDRAYGVSIIDDIRGRTGRQVSTGPLSVTLDRLEEKGLIESRYADALEGRGKRPRRYVKVTALGRRALKDSRDVMLAVWRGLESALK
ncbi:MAG TPA: helix-turn-helix transcriptional regulator [Vicinamibacterales bacterium]|nr:helix-turn-helix transcriptional regulator [Vicinamibacterales bacterium]